MCAQARKQSRPKLRHELKVEGEPGEMRVVVTVHGLTRGMDGVDLQVSETEVRLVAPDMEPLKAPLPFRVDSDTAKAKFSKSKESLKVTLLAAV